MGMEKKDKANFRRKCRNNYRFEAGQLFYKKYRVKDTNEDEQLPGRSEWKICVRSEEEKRRILESCHGSRAEKGKTTNKMAEGHFGRDKTIHKICSRYYWKNMVVDIAEFVQKCEECQRMNANFIKSNAKLHPIPVKANVWHQVSSACISLSMSIV